MELSDTTNYKIGLPIFHRERKARYSSQTIHRLNIAVTGSHICMGLITLITSIVLLAAHLYTYPIIGKTYVAVWVFMAMSVLLLICSVAGIVILLRDYRYATYRALLFFTALGVAGFIIILIMASVSLTDINADPETNLFRPGLTSMFVEAKSEFLKYSSTESATDSRSLQSWSEIETTHGCCGTDTYSNWAINNTYFLNFPDSCLCFECLFPICINVTLHVASSSEDQTQYSSSVKFSCVYTQGCVEPIMQRMRRHMTIVVVESAITSIVVLLGLFGNIASTCVTSRSNVVHVPYIVE